jgi:hypothetical protein
VRVDQRGAALLEPASTTQAVDRGVEAKIVREPLDFLLRACEANDATAVQFRGLANDRANCTGSTGHHDCLTRVWFADVPQFRVRVSVLHASTHVPVHGEIPYPDEYFTGLWFWSFALL